YVMRYISPYTVVLTYNFEPIYGILLAVIFFPENEIMSPLFYLGAGLIISTVLGNALYKYKSR
ncbi:MAG: EamA family transporter, partial [Bacteroidota bacterium]|nr:EamA family transporter [Bacteroidota bacterium]